MRIPQWLLDRLLEWRVSYRAEHPKPDFVIGEPDDPYMLRWWVIPHNRFFNIYLHRFLRSDDDRALHDHPWLNVSLILQGEYTEHTIRDGGVNHHDVYRAGELRFRGPRFAHRVELHDGPCWTLFITGPKVRTWGFHCRLGWVPWMQFVDESEHGNTGHGCGELS